MDHREVRNEFGLDENNASDVRKERINTPGVLGLIIGMVLIVSAGLIYAFSMGPNEHTGPTAGTTAPATTGQTSR
jgi:hypothetical protein